MKITISDTANRIILGVQSLRRAAGRQTPPWA